jgi:hypothetical protein
MAENTNSGSSNVGLAFIVGGVVVVLAIVAWFVFAGGGLSPEAKDVNVDVNLPDLPDARTLPETPRLPQVEPLTVPGSAPSE